MGINFKNRTVPQGLTLTSPAGLYKSAKGSMAIKPDTNSKMNGRMDGVDSVLVTDIDTGKTGIKKISDLKGTYTFVAPLDKVNVDVA